MYIFQPDRYLLRKDIGELGSRVTGRTLDVGAGEVDRYQDSFSSSEYIRMDVVEREGVDVVASADAMPFDDASFDSVICTQVLEHVAQPFKVVSEVTRVLKSGGILLLTVPQTNELHEEPHDYFRYTRYGLESMMEDVGMRVVVMRQRGGFYSLVAQIVIRYMIDWLGLYKRKFLGAIISKPLYLLGRFSIWLDGRNNSVANRKHTIGWTMLCQKV